MTAHPVQRRAVLGLVLAAGAAALALGAAGAVRADPVDLTVIDRETGQTLPLWRHGGSQFVAGRPGDRYGLRVSNNTPNRVLVVLSVDGVNVLTGETANYDQRGYIFRPYESYEISGWRKSDTTVAAFNFTALANSYAARTGRPGDVGVIGMAVFNERTYPPVEAVPAPAVSNQSYSYSPQDIGGQGARAQLGLSDGQRLAPPAPPAPVAGRGGAPMNAPVQPAPAAASNISGVKGIGSPVQRLNREDILRSGATTLSDALGTGHGAIERSVITIQPFERATAYPIFTWQVQYDSYDNLVARGVIPRYVPPRQPQAFPGAGYVPDPPR